MRASRENFQAGAEAEEKTTAVNPLREATGKSPLTRVEIDPREVAITEVAAAGAATQEVAAIETAAMKQGRDAPTTSSPGSSSRLRTSCAHSESRISPMR